MHPIHYNLVGWDQRARVCFRAEGYYEDMYLVVTMAMAEPDAAIIIRFITEG